MSPSAEAIPIENLEDLLAETLGRNFQLEHVDWKPLTDPGENFGSIILAINVTIVEGPKREKLHLVGKLPPKSAYLLDLFNSPVTFKKELYFYSDITKEFRKLELEHNVINENLSKLAPKFVGGRLGIENPKLFDSQAAIILENLKESGYVSQDRINGLDKSHTEFAIKELAKLHALAIALKLNKPEFFNETMIHVLKEKVNETAEKCLADMIRKAQQDIKNIPETEKYTERIEKTVSNGIKNIQGRVPEEPWGTMIHNDFWVNNMMFRHNKNGDVTDLKMVDFQLCAYDYGMCDLIFFLMSSAQIDVLDNHLDEMLDVYYNSFINCLKLLKVDSKKFPRQKFDQLIDYCAPLKFTQCIMMVQVIQASKQSTNQLKSLDGEDMFLNRMGDDIINKKLLHTVSLFVKRDWLLK